MLTALVGVPAAKAALQPIGLSVDEGEGWRPARLFTLRWSNPPGTAAVHYRLLGPFGELASSETRVPWPATTIPSLSTPSAPGAYTAEVWLEDEAGAQGAADVAKLRFDDRAPGTVEVVAPGGWIGRAAFPYRVQLGHPAGALPPSGIRGYAVTVDRAEMGGPCAAAVCTDAETDLRGGPDDDEIAVGELPEGINFLHAAGVSGSGVHSVTAATATLRVDKTDPVVHLSGVPEGWSNRPLTLVATAVDPASGMDPHGPGPHPFTAIRIDGGAPAVGAGDTVSASAIASGIHTVAFYGRDAAGNVADGGNANGLPNHSPATATVKIDRQPPRLAFAGAQDPRDPERIEARATDALSGIDRARGSIEVRAAGSGKPFAALPTTVAGGTLRARWDSAACPAGEYEFRVTAFDLAGNSTSTRSRVSGAEMRLRAPLKRAPKLSIRLGRRELPYGQGTRLIGSLAEGRHAPLAGMRVRVLERFDAGAAARERVSTTTTDERGAFEVRVGAGASREIVAVTPVTPTLRGGASRPLRLAVRGRVGLRASAAIARVGGRPVVFTGIVGTAGAVIPDDGKVVELQFRLPGLPWQEFRTVRTDRRGRFRYSYRFADDDSRGARFQFRAVAPAQTGWPYLTASSRPVAVRGAQR